MLAIPKSIRLQTAADDAYVIGETIETLGALMDLFYERHGEELGKRLTALIPWSCDAGPTDAKKVNAFAHSLEPPEAE